MIEFCEKTIIMKTTLLLFLTIPLFTFSQVKINQTILGANTVNYFGNSVALSNDGSIIAVGAPGTGNNSYVRIYKNENNTWTQIGNDIINTSILEKVGFSVSISGDGSIVAVGASEAGNLDEGYTRIYKNINDVWTQIGIDIIGQNWFDEEGSSIALSNDGTIVATGAIYSDPNGSKSGKVRVFKNINDVWTQMGTNINGDANGDEFGTKIALSDNGLILAVSAIWSNANGTDSGQVKVFQFENNNWVQMGADLVGEFGSNYFGNDVSLSSNGLTLATVDGRRNNASTREIEIYKFENDAWSLKGNKITIPIVNSPSGSLALSGDGNSLAFGDYFNNIIKLYQFQNDTWSQKGADITKQSGNYFGFDVALSNDGSKLAVGWPYADHTGANNVGAVDVYDYSAVLSVDAFNKEKINIYPNPVLSILKVNHQINSDFIINIYNLQGRRVLVSNTETIDVSKLSKGVYFLQIKTSQFDSFKKFIKQ